MRHVALLALGALGAAVAVSKNGTATSTSLLLPMSSPSAQTSQTTEASPSAQTSETLDAAATVARWREDLELELPADVLERGPALVAEGGALAAEPRAVALVARALFDAGREAEALALLDAATARIAAAHHAPLELARARLHLLRDELAACVDLLRAEPGAPLPVRHPAEPESWLLLGRALARAGQRDGADLLLQGFLERAPRHPEASAAWHALAQHALARRDLERARSLRERAEAAARWQAYYKARRLQVRESPDAPLPRLGLAKLWLAADEPARARDELLALTALAPEFCAGWSHLGEAHRLTGATDAARAAFDRAVACDPADLEALLWRGLLAEHEGRDAAARADLERVLADPAREADPASAPAHAALARVLDRAGETEAAETHRRRAAELGGR